MVMSHDYDQPVQAKVEPAVISFWAVDPQAYFHTNEAGQINRATGKLIFVVKDKSDDPDSRPLRATGHCAPAQPKS
jgi:hypothetical protein